MTASHLTVFSVFLTIPGTKLSGVTGERLDRMEEDLRHLTQGLDTLKGVVVGLEERLRTSLREDTNKLLVSLLPNAPRVHGSTVGFGVLPVESPDGLEGGQPFAGFGDIAGRVTEVKDELRAKTHMLEEIQVLYEERRKSSVTSLSGTIFTVSSCLCNSLGNGLGSRWSAKDTFGRSWRQTHPWSRRHFFCG